MKKYLLGLALFALALVPNVSLAQTPSNSVGGVASSVSGKAPACPFISRTLNLVSRGSEVSSLQEYLISGGYLEFDGPTGYFGALTRQAVRNWQRANNLKAVNGIFGPESNRLLSSLCNFPPSTNTGGITINSVSGPNSLKIGQSGTWTVNATGPSGANLTYSVDWGERYNSFTGSLSSKEAVSQTSTFTHSYSQSGTYTVKFTVRNNVDCKYPSITGNTANSSFAPCGTSAQSSLTVQVESASTEPAIVVTYPLAGYSLYNGLGKGDGTPATNPIGTITWTSSNLGNFPMEISLLNTSGQLVKTIATDIQNTGSYRWNYDPTILSGKYTLLIDLKVKDGTLGSGAGRSGIFSITTDLSQTISQPSVAINPSNSIVASYNRDGKNLDLKATFIASISAGNSDIYLFQIPFGVTFINSIDGDDKTSLPACRRTVDNNSSLPLVNGAYGSQFFLLKANQTARFTTSIACPTEKMFPGSYHGQINNLNYVLNPNSNDQSNYASLDLSRAANNQTKRLTIVGEKSPWLDSASVQADPSSTYWVTLQGQRLSKLTNITVGSKSGYTASKFSDSSVTFQLGSVAAGSYPVTVENAVGKSNAVYITIPATPSSIPSCTLSSDKNSYLLDDEVTLSWTSQNATYATWQQDTSGRDYLNLPGDKLETRGSMTIKANVVGNPVITLLVKGYSGSASSCSKTISIVAPTGTICAKDIKTCPDGSSVGRTGPNCDFVCPVPTPRIPCPLAPVPACIGGTLNTTYNSNNCPVSTCTMSQNILRNNDFSVGLANWSLLGSNSATNVQIINGALQMTGTGLSTLPVTLVQQMVSVKAGYTYEYGGSIQTNLGTPVSPATDNVCQIDVFNSPLDTDSISARGVSGPTDYNSSVIIPAGKTYVQLRLLAVGPIKGTCSFDNLYFREAAVQPSKTALIQQAQQLASALAAVRAAIAALGGL